MFHEEEEEEEEERMRGDSVCHFEMIGSFVLGSPMNRRNPLITYCCTVCAEE
jgi:hypothetical protein